ncbi:MAG: hypothetical protein ABI439_03110 [Rhodospirillales bacterium]
MQMIGALSLALVFIVSPAIAQQKGSLAPGAKVEVATDADSFTSFSFSYEAKKAETVEMVGPASTKQITVEPGQRVGYSAKYAGKKVTLVNKGDVAISYDVN